MTHFSRTLAFTFFVGLHSALSAQLPIVDDWHYLLRQPREGWQRPEFDSARWRQGSGGFGTRGTPAARIGTEWRSNDIWMRKSFDLAAVPESVALLMHHDEDVEVYLNGVQVVRLNGYTTSFEVIPLNAEQRGVLKVGTNVLAVHCHQTGGGQFIDVHLVDAENVPKLPQPKRSMTPFKSDLTTTWGAELTPENAWTEYPRPQLERSAWQNLNGQWNYTIAPRQQVEVPNEWSGKILVPFCLESKLGGVQRLLDETETLWYERTFDIAQVAGKRTHLNFEAVDYRCEVIVNGKSVGGHRGGNTPFSVDITDAVQAGQNSLVVRVEDDTEGYQLNGKQRFDPQGIWYTPVTGIWQTVWLEQTAQSYIEDLHISTVAETGTITVKADIVGEHSKVKLRVLDGDKLIASAVSDAAQSTINVPDAKLWTPDAPHLYAIQLELLDQAGAVIDTVSSYAGIRTVGKMRDQDGHWRYTLNGKAIFHWGPLDQGWWPDGLLTPPSDEAMLFDIEYLKAAGFNMIRKHIKVEPRRYYYHCDRLGMLMWQDQVSAGRGPDWTRMAPNPRDAEWPEEHHAQYLVEFEEMVDLLENHPCIVSWVPFNEAWGQHRTVEVGNWIVKRDPSRSINIASGGNFWPVGDVADEHSYPNPGFPFDDRRFDDYIKVVGEFGGHGYPVEGHLWDANRENWGYGGLPKDAAEYKARYVTSLKMLNEFRKRGISGGVYTQTTDVEGEINGLITYDRKVIKIPANELAELHQMLFE